MRNIHVDPAELELCAGKIDGFKQAYEQDIQQLYQAIGTMQNGWKGKDNLAFTDEIQKYEKDLRFIAILSGQYMDFLKHSARAYRDMQDEIAMQANRILK